MTPAAVFWLVTWAIFWWHLARWLVRLAVIAAAVGAAKKGRQSKDAR